MATIKTIYDSDNNTISTIYDVQSISVGGGGGGGGLDNVVEDTSPQLGGDLDLNSNDITGTGNITHTGTITTTGNIVVSGTVDGRDVATDGTKLDGIEAGATADQTGAEIKAAYEAEADTNAFTDADHSKLDGIAAGAEVNTVDSVNTQTGAVVLDADDISDTSTTNKFTTAANLSKLAGIESGATADQTDAEIETAYNTQVSQVSGGEITAGTETAIRRYSPADVKNFVDTHGGGSSVVYFAGYSTQTATITQDTWTDLEIAVETKKDSGYTHSTSTNPEQITLDAAGVYLISVNVMLETGTIRTDGSVRLQVDTGGGFADLTGVVGYGTMNSAPFGTVAETVRTMCIPLVAYSAGAGDVIKAQVYVDSAGDWDFTSGSSITIQKIS